MSVSIEWTRPEIKLDYLAVISEDDMAFNVFICMLHTHKMSVWAVVPKEVEVVISELVNLKPLCRI